MTKNEERILQVVNDAAETADMMPVGNAAPAMHMLSKKIAEIIGEGTDSWVLVEDGTGICTNRYRCPKCGEIQVLPDGTPRQKRWFYCPHCGTKLFGIVRDKECFNGN